MWCLALFFLTGKKIEPDPKIWFVAEGINFFCLEVKKQETSLFFHSQRNMTSPITCPRGYDPHSLLAQSDATPSDYTSVSQLYSAMRMFGSPNAVKLAMSQSDQTPLTTTVNAYGKQQLQAVNYTALDSVMTGRTDRDLAPGDVRGNSYNLLPTYTNTFRGPIRAEDFIGTVSSRTEYGEIANTRIETNNSYQPRMLNLVPTSANAACREKEVARLNKLNDAYVAARLASVL